MKKLFTLFLLCSSISVFAQGTQPPGNAMDNLDVSNINPTILMRGDLFHNQLYGRPLNPFHDHSFEVPRGSGKHTLYAGALWLGGKDQQNNLYVASQTYRQGTPSQAGYWPGPVATNQDSSHTKKYDKIWKISKAEIKHHIANYYKPGYVMPANIATWPGNGDITKGEAAKLAPFVDKNNDGIYSPSQGDYPEIKGDQALYLILNDRGNLKVPASLPMNAEIHLTVFGFENKTNPAAYNTLFTHYRVINRGNLNLKDFYAGIWTDIDIGNYKDDYIGCDTLTNRYYGYNSDNYDEGPEGYGINPPVQSVIFLDQKMSHFLHYYNNNNPVSGSPRFASDHYNFMRGYWRNNTPVTYGGDGTDQQRPPFPYMYPGDPLTMNGWSETNTLTIPSANPLSDRKGVGSIGPFNFMPGQEIKFTVAYNFSQGDSTINSLTQAQLDAQAIHDFFNTNFFVEEVEEPEPDEPLRTRPNLVLYPNPASEKLTVQLPSGYEDQATTIRVTDYLGRSLITYTAPLQKPEVELNIRELPKGIYQILVTSGNQHKTARFVKQ